MKERVRVELHGGLGNQLFQYYAGAFLALKYDCQLELDFTHLVYGHEKHVVESVRMKETFLDLLDLPGKRIIRSEISHSTERIIRRTLKYSGYFDRHLLAPKLLEKTFESKAIGFDPIFGQRCFSRIGGYFQTYKYFEYVTSKNGGYRPSLQNSTSWFKETLKYIIEKKPVIVHLRKHYPSLNNVFMPCDIQYYTEALIKLRNLIGDFEILVFGLGDLDANSFIPNEFLENCSFVTKADNSPDVESLILMSYAPALVTANSTFSWWSGNLASQKTIVIAPSKIFLNKHNPIDYYPQKWIKL